MDQESNKGKDNKQRIINLTLAALAAQVGCVTLIIIVGALFLGIWLDNQFQTKPTFTLILTLGSIPVSLVIMFFIAQNAVKKIKTAGMGKKINGEEENSVGK